MLYNPLLNKAASKLITRGALQYVYQDPNGCEFVATDGTVMLVENNGTPFMNEFWDTITQMPTDCAYSYPDWATVLLHGYKDANKPWSADRVRFQKGLAVLNNLYVSAKTYQLVKDFIGPDMIINIPNSLGLPIYFRSVDGKRRALILPYELTSETVDKAFWNVLDHSGTIIYTTSDIMEAEIFNLTVKLAGDK